MSCRFPGADQIFRESKLLANVITITSLGSTDTLARMIINEAAEDELELAPTLILAASQRQGRGRRGHSWASPEGGLYLNYLRSLDSEEQLRSLSLCAAVALCKVLDELGFADAGIKWPNDILLRGGKVAGFLCYVLRGEISFACVGLGLNLRIAPDPGPGARYPATALADTGELGDLQELIAGIVIRFTAQLEEALEDLPGTRGSWISRLVHRRGERLRVSLESGEEVNGIFEGVDDLGSLQLKTEGGLRTLSAGDVFPG